jgi:hypothetical protein
MVLLSEAEIAAFCRDGTLTLPGFFPPEQVGPVASHSGLTKKIATQVLPACELVVLMHYCTSAFVSAHRYRACSLAATRHHPPRPVLLPWAEADTGACAQIAEWRAQTFAHGPGRGRLKVDLAVSPSGSRPQCSPRKSGCYDGSPDGRAGRVTQRGPGSGRGPGRARELAGRVDGRLALSARPRRPGGPPASPPAAPAAAPDRAGLPAASGRGRLLRRKERA